MNIEEARKHLKKNLNNWKKLKKDNGYMPEIMEEINTDYKAIETLLTAYEEEKEDNKELRKYYATRKEVEELREINKILHDSAENYIHKDKIIAKVIEVKDRPVKDEFITATHGKLNTIIDIESLLGKE